MNFLNEILKEDKEYSNLLSSLEKGRLPLAAFGLSAIHKSMLAAALSKHLNKKIMLLTHDEASAFELSDNLKEMGLIPLNLKKITEIYPSPGYTDEVIAVFYADEFEKGNIHFDDTEDLTSEWVDIDVALKMVEDGRIKDGKTVIALLWYKSGLRI